MTSRLKHCSLVGGLERKILITYVTKDMHGTNINVFIFICEMVIVDTLGQYLLLLVALYIHTI